MFRQRKTRPRNRQKAPDRKREPILRLPAKALITLCRALTDIPVGTGLMSNPLR